MLWQKYNGVKIACWDKDLVGSDDFMGEVFLWLDYDIPAPPEMKEFRSELQSRKGKRDKVSGYLTIQSSFQSTQAPAAFAQEVRKPAQLGRTDSADLKATAVSRSKLVQISSTGRREVKVAVNAAEKFVSFGELPKFDTIDQSVEKKELRKYGFNDNIALWLVTCCNLSYKTEEVIGEVAKNVWGTPLPLSSLFLVPLSSPFLFFSLPSFLSPRFFFFFLELICIPNTSFSLSLFQHFLSFFFLLIFFPFALSPGIQINFSTCCIGIFNYFNFFFAFNFFILFFISI